MSFGHTLLFSLCLLGIIYEYGNMANDSLQSYGQREIWIYVMGETLSAPLVSCHWFNCRCIIIKSILVCLVLDQLVIVESPNCCPRCLLPIVVTKRGWAIPPSFETQRSAESMRWVAGIAGWLCQNGRWISPVQSSCLLKDQPRLLLRRAWIDVTWSYWASETHWIS